MASTSAWSGDASPRCGPVWSGLPRPVGRCRRQAGSAAATWWKNDRISSEPGIAGGDRVAPLLLKLVEKGENEIPIEILECSTPPAPCANGPRQRGSACAGRRDSWPRSQAWRYAAWPVADGNRTPGVARDKSCSLMLRLRRGRRAQLRWRGDPMNRSGNRPCRCNWRGRDMWQAKAAALGRQRAVDARA